MRNRKVPMRNKSFKGLDIRKLKMEFITKYPDHILCNFLKNTPDKLEPEEFLMLSQIWIKILNENKR
jgi:hypothetical protein